MKDIPVIATVGHFNECDPAFSGKVRFYSHDEFQSTKDLMYYDVEEWTGTVVKYH